MGKVLDESGQLQTPLRTGAQLARYHTQGRASRGERVQHLLDTGIHRDAGVVMKVMVFAVSDHHLLDEVCIRSDRAELLAQGRAQPVKPNLVGRQLAHVRSGGVTVAAKNELDRVEQRAVEIEEIGVEPVLRH